MKPPERGVERQRRTWPASATCVLIDVSILAIALCAAFLARFDGSPPPEMVTVLAWNLPLVVVLQYSLLAAWRVPPRCWSFLGLPDLPPILYAVSSAAALLLAIRYVGAPLAASWPALDAIIMPTGVILIDAALAMLGITGARCLRRLQVQNHRRHQFQPSRTHKRALLIGAGWSGSMLLQELRDRTNLGIDPVAFVDDDLGKTGHLIGGLCVAGTTAQLAQLKREHSAELALIAIANADGGALQRIIERCKAADLDVKIIPHIREIVSGTVRVSQMRDVKIEDLLGREPVQIEDSAAGTAITGKIALVTGAGGSIGSELCRQIVQLRPKRLVLVERTENSLYEIHRELFGNNHGVPVVQELADVTDHKRMEYIFTTHHPQAILHAAAHKHVPMMELLPGEAIKNNVFGTKMVADLADRFGAERFLLVSTDKAVNPSSVMGSTKRLAELYIKDLDKRSDVRFTSVRFGNVMGSAGSVIPLFREQIARGGPLTVTHPDMERFFMTIPEASRLVLEAAGLGVGGQVMVLDMGKPVKIRHLAEQMIRLSGFEPGAQIKIVYSGVRPGEKLYEELALPEEFTEQTRCQKLFVWRGGDAGICIPEVLERLRSPGETAEEIRETLRSVLPEFHAPALAVAALTA